MKTRSLYIIRCGTTNYYKIGISDIPESRIKELQIGNPFKLQLIYQKVFLREYVDYLEGFLHRHFDMKRVRGEWFELSLKRVDRLIECLNDSEAWDNKYRPEVDDLL